LVIPLLQAQPPQSGSYVLQQQEFLSGPADYSSPPSSGSFIMAETASGGIADDHVVGPGHHHYPGFLVPESSLPAPENLLISIDAGLVHLSWDPVPGAAAYAVYSATDPYGSYSEDLTGTYPTSTEWSAPLTGPPTFYQVTARSFYYPPLASGNKP